MITSENRLAFHHQTMQACISCDFETVRKNFKGGYLSLLTDSNFDLFSNMCYQGNPGILKFLWDNQVELGYKIDLHFNDNQPFKYTCVHKKLDNATYLILEHDIEKHPQVKEFLDTQKFKIYPKIMSVIASKELNNKLENNLDLCQPSTRKLKI